MTTHHDLKLIEDFEPAKRDGRKLWEYRSTEDRTFAVGDTVTFHYVTRESRELTGQTYGPVTITYCHQVSDQRCVFSHTQENDAMKWNDFIYDPRLPKANLIWFKWSWFWFRSLWDKTLGRQPRLPWRLLFWLPCRMANAWSVFLGPVEIGWRRPWLAGPAGHELERLDRIEALNR